MVDDGKNKWGTILLPPGNSLLIRGSSSSSSTTGNANSLHYRAQCERLLGELCDNYKVVEFSASGTHANTV